MHVGAMCGGKGVSVRVVSRVLVFISVWTSRVCACVMDGAWRWYGVYAPMRQVSLVC